jgi:hypothetical protein
MIDPARVRPRVRARLASKTATDRVAAAYLLGCVGEAEDRARVGALVKDPSPAVRAAAARAAGRLRAEELADALVSLLSDPVELVQVAAAEGLGSLSSGDAAKLRAAASDPRFDVRRAAARSAAKRGDASVAGELVRLIAADPLDEWLEELEALARLGAAPVAELARRRARVLDDPTAWSLLAASGDAEAVKRLAADGTQRSAAALIAAGHASDRAALAKLLDASEPWSTGEFLLALNRLVDPKRYDTLARRWHPARWAPAGRDGFAKALSECLGVPVRADASAPDRRDPMVLTAETAFGTGHQMVPVFEGDGIVLYSFAAARQRWKEKLK